MKLSQSELEQIDEEVQSLRKIHTSERNLYLSWLSSKGAITLTEKDFVQYPIKKDSVTKKGLSYSIPRVFSGPRTLYEKFSDQFEEYQRWKRNGKKSTSISNFGIDEIRNQESTNPRVAEQRSDVQEFSDEDIPFGRED